MGVLGTVKQVVFVVDTSSALSGLFNMMLTNYIVPCVEYFNGGPVEKTDISQSSSVYHQYGLVTINPSPLFSVPSCDYWPITNSSKTLLQYFRNIRFEGGLIEHCCRVSDGLAAALEFLDLMGKFAQKNDQADAKIEKYCIFITNLPPSPMPVVESLTFGGRSYLQLAEHMAKNDINLSVISPRWLSPYKELFLKGSQSSDVSAADHGLHPGCMVLLHGLELTDVKALKVKSDSDTQDDVKPVTVPPSPSLSTSQATPGSVGSVPPSQPNPTMNTPSPGQTTELQQQSGAPSLNTATLDKSPLTKASSASSLTESYPWIHSNSPKVTSNPASVGSITMPASSGLSHEIPNPMSISMSIAHSPQSVPSPQQQQRTSHASSSGAPTVPPSSALQQTAPSFPLQSTSFTSANSTPTLGTLNLSSNTPHDPLGSISNPIQITSPGADANFHTSLSSSSSSAAGIGSAASTHTLTTLMSPASSSLTSSAVTSPPFSFGSSMSSTMSSHMDITSISSALESSSSQPVPSSISSLLMGNNPTPIPPTSIQQPLRPPVPSQTPTPPPPSTKNNAVAVAAEILIQATREANKNPSGGIGAQRLPGVSNPTNTTFPPQQMSSTSIGPAGHNPGIPTGPSQVSPMQVWNGVLETFETRANNPKQPRLVQCSIHVSKPETTQEIKPDLWPNKLTMSIHSKNLFNTLTLFFRNNQNQLRTVHFQFMERPENVMMLRALMNNDLPQNKKIGIVQLNGPQQCPIKAFFIICQEKGSSRQFTGLIPLDQDKFLTTLKQAIAMQQRQQLQPQQQPVQRVGIPSSLNPAMTQQQQLMTQQTAGGGGASGLSSAVGQGPQSQPNAQLMSAGGGGTGTMDGQNTSFTTQQQQAVGGPTAGGGSGMFMQQQQQGMSSQQNQQQNYSSMMSSQMSQQQQGGGGYMSGGGGGGTGGIQSMMQQMRSTNMQMGGGGAQQQQQQMGGGLGGQQLGQQQSLQQQMGSAQQQQMGGGQQMLGGQQQQQQHMGGGQQQMMGGQQPMGGQQQIGGQMGGQQQMAGQQMMGSQMGGQQHMTQQQLVEQALKNATPEKRQLIFAKLEQQRVMRQQQQQYQQQQQGQHYQQQYSMQQQQHMQQQLNRPSLNQPQQMQPQPQGGQMQQNTQQTAGANTLSFFEQF